MHVSKAQAGLNYEHLNNYKRSSFIVTAMLRGRVVSYEVIAVSGKEAKRQINTQEQEQHTSITAILKSHKV